MSTHFRNILYVAAACCMTACASSHAPIISRYSSAACIPFSVRPQITPRTREWDTTLSLHDGSKVIVRGAQVVGGKIIVSYPATGQTVVAADAGDYVYPSDVRIDAQNDILYIKVYGLAGGMFEQTWLFEYDLHGHQIMERHKIKNGILPAECPERLSSQ
jgi:hypothetical protein